MMSVLATTPIRAIANNALLGSSMAAVFVARGDTGASGIEPPASGGLQAHITQPHA
jgi:hypothetical protein